MLHLGDVFRRRQQEQDRVEIAFFRHDAVFTQVVGQNGRRDAEFAVAAGGGIDARRGEQQFARIDEVLRFCIALKGVPFSPGTKLKKRRSLAIAAVS